MRFGIAFFLLLIAGCATEKPDHVPATNRLSGEHINTLTAALGTADEMINSDVGTTYRWKRQELVETSSYGNYQRSVQGTCILVVTTDPSNMIIEANDRGHYAVCMYFREALSLSTD